MKKRFLGLALMSSCLLFYPAMAHAEDSQPTSSSQTPQRGSYNPDDPFFPIAPTEKDLKDDQIKPGDIPLPKEEVPEIEGFSSFRSASKVTLDATNQQIAAMPLAPIVQNYAPEFPRFGYSDGVGKPRGVIIHETANPNSTIFNEITYMRRNYNNAFVQAFVDADNIIEIHPTDYASWGSGRYGNAHFVQVELVRHPGNRTKFYRSINNQAYYAAHLLKKYGLAPTRANDNSTPTNPLGSIWGHFEVSNMLGGTDHGDPLGYYQEFGYTFSQFFELVRYHYRNLPDTFTNQKHFSGEGLPTTLNGGSYPIYKEIPNTGKGETVLTTTNGNHAAVRVTDVVTTATDTWAKVRFDKTYGWISQKALSQGWVQDGENWYYYGDNFEVATGFNQIGNNTFYFDNNGLMKQGWQIINGTYYFFSPLGAMMTGWLQLGNDWYFLNPNGQMLTGWQVINNQQFYFDISGRMVKGLATIGGKRYYFNTDGSLHTGAKNINGVTHYFAATGEEVTSGWINLPEGYAYIQPGQGLLKNFQLIGGKWYLFNDSGIMQTNWQQVGGKWYYLYEDGHMADNEWIYPKGNHDWFLLKVNGELAIGLTQLGNDTFYFGPLGDMRTGFQKVNNQWYYFNASGKMAYNEWLVIDGKWYFFKREGVMVTGLSTLGDKTYHFKEDGSMTTNWLDLNGKRYFFNEKGHRIENQWYRIDNHWYFFEKDGNMAKNKTVDGYKLNEFGTY